MPRLVRAGRPTRGYRRGQLVAGHQVPSVADLTSGTPHPRPAARAHRRPSRSRAFTLVAGTAACGYTAVFDPAALGQGFEVIINADLVAKDRATVEAFETRVSGMAEVVELRRMFGLPEYLIRARVTDAVAYEQWLMTQLLGDPAVARVDSRITMKTVKSAR